MMHNYIGCICLYLLLYRHCLHSHQDFLDFDPSPTSGKLQVKFPSSCSFYDVLHFKSLTQKVKVLSRTSHFFPSLRLTCYFLSGWRGKLGLFHLVWHRKVFLADSPSKSSIQPTDCLSLSVLDHHRTLNPIIIGLSVIWWSKTDSNGLVEPPNGLVGSPNGLVGSPNGLVGPPNGLIDPQMVW